MSTTRMKESEGEEDFWQAENPQLILKLMGYHQDYLQSPSLEPRDNQMAISK
jgi:hypothetical protein